jgi:hypothetical protein
MPGSVASGTLCIRETATQLSGFVSKARLLAFSFNPQKLNGHTDSDFLWLLVNAGMISFQQATAALFPFNSPHTMIVSLLLLTLKRHVQSQGIVKPRTDLPQLVHIILLKRCSAEITTFICISKILQIN